MAVINICALFVAVAGIVEFFLQHRYFLSVFPKSMLAALIGNNPGFALMYYINPYRNGLYRASSIYLNSLSFAEFEVMVIPIALFFLIESRRAIYRLMGLSVIFTGLIAIFSSGARGGYVSLLVSTAAFTFLSALRRRRTTSNSLAPGFIAIIGVQFFAAIVALIVFWRRAHNLVLGGGDAESSTQARYDQWSLGLPHILSNPITGHGFPLGAEIIGWGQGPGSFH